MDPKETAVLFIEFQNDFCTTRGMFHELAGPELERLETVVHARDLLEAARRSGAGVIHCPFVYDADWCKKTRSVGLLETIRQNGAFQPNTWGAAIIEELAPRGREVVLSGKRGLSAFGNTELNHVLKTGDYRNLLVCGLLTNVCVQATAFSAYDRGMNTRIVLDACASGSRECQEYVENNVARILGGPLYTAEVIAEWS